MPEVNCPVCHGTGVYFDQDHRGRARENTCTACKGSRVLHLTQAQFDRRERELLEALNKPKQPFRHRFEWSAVEMEIVAEMKPVQWTIDKLKMLGYTRSYRSVCQRRYKIRCEMEE